MFNQLIHNQGNTYAEVENSLRQEVGVFFILAQGFFL